MIRVVGITGCTVRPESVGSPDGVALLRVYFTEMASRYFGREATDAEVHAAMAEDPSTDLTPPAGVFLVLRQGPDAVGCVGVRVLTPGLAELKRMFVRQGARCRGAGRLLLAAAEEAGKDLGAHSIRLDTRHDLVEARALYTASGYVEIPAYSDALYADHWFEKRL